MEIDRRLFIASLGGAASVSLMDSEARADALEDYMSQQLDNAADRLPTASEVEAEIETRGYRRGTGSLFLPSRSDKNVKKLVPMPANATLLDFFQLRFAPANHVLQSA